MQRIQILEFSFGRWSLSWLFLVALVGIVTGGLLIKKLMQREIAAQVDAAKDGGVSVEQTMEEVQGWLGALAREVLDEAEPAQANLHITRQLDELGKNQLAAVLDARPILLSRFGLGGYAEFMSHFSVLERRVNRAWSAAADGVNEESVDCLAQAVHEARQVQDWLQARA